MRKITVICAFVFGLFLALSSSADAAKLHFQPKSIPLGIGDEFTLNVRVNTEGDFINATQAEVRFPNDLMEVTAVDREGSAFGFWVEEPYYSNEDGTVNFVGGSAKGISSESLHVLKIKFKVTGAGSGEITFSGALVTASDGKGTNVLSTIESASVSVGTKRLIPPPPEIPETKEAPQKVERVAVVATGLPEAPKLRVPLYSDESRWYSHVGETIVFWDLPPDVTQVSTRLSRSRDESPGVKDDDLFTGKSMGVLEEEGIWYIRVQFKNNVGWGPLSYYKISLDTTAPLPFEIEIDNAVSDNPSPLIKYETNDSLSGIAGYVISVDGQRVLETASSTVALPPQPPGAHKLSVRAVDLAGNSVEDNEEFEVLPLPTPTIDFITRSVAQEEFIFVSGKTIPSGFVDLSIANSRDQEVFRGAFSSDALGSWEAIIEDTFARGKYILVANARDERGAISYPTEAEEFKIKAKTILSIGFIDFGWFELVIIILLLVLAGGSSAAWYYVSMKQTREAYKIIAGRDVEKLNNIMAKDLKELNDWITSPQAKLTPHAKSEAEYFAKKMQDTVAKMKKYLNQELSKLR
jgi:hypothetical protein